MPERTPPEGQVIPEGYTFDSMGTCRGCGARMAWTVTPKGAKAPLDADGTSHFVTCPDRDRFRKGKKA